MTTQRQDGRMGEVGAVLRLLEQTTCLQRLERVDFEGQSVPANPSFDVRANEIGVEELRAVWRSQLGFEVPFAARITKLTSICLREFVTPALSFDPGALDLRVWLLEPGEVVGLI